MGGSSTISISETKAEALTLQSSAYGVTVPVLGGQNRIAGNLLYYNDFKAIPHTKTQSSGKGGGAKTKNTTYTYAVNVLMGICHGQVGAVSTVWVDKRVYKGGWPKDKIQTAKTEITVAASLQYTLPYASTALSEPTIKLKSSGGFSDVKSLVGKALVVGKHYTYEAGVVTFVAPIRAGMKVLVTYQYGVGSPSLTPLQQIGATLMRGDAVQPAAAWLTAIHPDNARTYPGLAYIHAQDYDLGSSTSVDNHSFEIQGWGAYSVDPNSPDCNPAAFAEMVLTHTRFGARLPGETVDTDLWETYCAAAGILMSPVLKEQQRAADFIEEMARLTNSAPVWSYDTLRVVPYGDLPLTGNGVTYTPNTTPIYDLDDDCWLADADEDPIEWELKQPSDRYNIVKVEYCNRSTYYNRTIVEARDDADIALNGERQMDTVVCTWICDGEVARLVAQLILQRSLLVTGTGRVRLPWAYCLLEPMDLLTVTDAALGFVKLPVRVTSVVETEEGDLELELEDWPLGVADAARYQAPPAAGFLHDYGVAPGAVVAPVIFEAPVDRTTTGLEIYAAVRGNSDAWGGCRMWVSLDGLNYREAAIVYGGARYGTLTGPVSSGTLPVQTSGQLVAASADDADALETLCFVGGSSPEYLAYTTATLTGAGAYTLGGLIRGAYGTATAAHAAGDAFVRVDDRVAKSGPLDAVMIGSVIWLKFTSFNVYQAEEESLADVPAYSYTITGSMAALKPGIAGKGITVAASALTFQYPAAGGVNPASITLKASRKGTLAGAVSWSVISGTATVTGSGDTVTIAASSMTTDAVTVRATIVDPVATYTADTTLVKVREGAKGDTGSPGSRYASAKAYRWGTGAAPTAVGTATWNWSAGSYDTAPSGWSKTPGTAPSAGYTLWQAERVLTDAAGTTATTSIDWAAAGISAISVAGQTGGTARIAYAKSASSTLATTPDGLQTSGATSFPAANTWGGSETWGATVPTPSAGEWVYQVNGVHNPATGLTTWGLPFVATFRVGSLSALSANLGAITGGSLNINNRWIVDDDGGARLLDEAGNVVLSTQTGGASALNPAYAAEGTRNSDLAPGQNRLANTDQATADGWERVNSPNGAVFDPAATGRSRVVGPALGWTTENFVMAGPGLDTWLIRQVGVNGGSVDPSADDSGNAVACDIYFRTLQGQRLSGSAPVIPGERLCWSVYMTTRRCTTRLYVLFLGSDGAELLYVAGDVFPESPANSASLGSMPRRHMIVTAPAGAAKVVGFVRKFSTFAGQSDSYVFLAAPQLESIGATATGPSAYTPGGLAEIGQQRNILGGSGGLVAGTLTWDAAGTPTGGYGVAMTAKGIVGRNASGVTTFALDATTGDVVHRGKTETGNAPAISGSTMTGSGALFNPDGTGCWGNSTSSIVRGSDGKIYINQPVITDAPGPAKVMGSYFVASSRVVAAGTSVTLTALLQFRSDGSIWQSVNNPSTGVTVSSQIGNWYVPNTASVGNDYDVFMRRTAGDTTGYSTGAGDWTQISATRSVQVTYTGTGAFAFELTGIYAVRRRSDGVQVGNGSWGLALERAV